MIYVNHRVNTIEELAKVPRQNGIELDIRYHENALVVHHEPFGHHETAPDHFEEFCKNWHHRGPMILNLKTEGIEDACIDLMNAYCIKNWFFLDMSMPFFAVYAEKAFQKNIVGLSPLNLAVRFSEREPIEYALSFAGKAGWVWVDCFSRLPMDETIHGLLKNAGFNICLVSPELQKHSEGLIENFKQQCANLDIDAVCTKRPDLWAQK